MGLSFETLWLPCSPRTFTQWSLPQSIIIRVIVKWWFSTRLSTSIITFSVKKVLSFTPPPYIYFLVSLWIRGSSSFIQHVIDHHCHSSSWFSNCTPLATCGSLNLAPLSWQMPVIPWVLLYNVHNKMSQAHPASSLESAISATSPCSLLVRMKSDFKALTSNLKIFKHHSRQTKHMCRPCLGCRLHFGPLDYTAFHYV